MDECVVKRKISVTSLFYYIFREWRKLLIGGVIGFLLLGLFFVVKNRDILFAKKPTENEGTQVVKPVSEEYTSMVSALTGAVNNYKSVARELENYQKNSIIMKMEPFQVPTKSLDYRLIRDNDTALEKKDNALSKALGGNYYNTSNNIILSSYVNDYLPSKFDWDSLAKQVNIEPVYLKEIITFSQYNGNTFRVIVRHNEKDGTEKIAKFVKEDVNRIQKVVSKDVYFHELDCVESDVIDNYDGSVFNKQLEISNQIRNMYNCFMDANRQLNEYKKNNSGHPQVVVKVLPVKELIKHMVVGFLLGIFVVALFYFCKFTFVDRIHTAKEIGDTFGLLFLGNLNKKASTSNNKFDLFIEKVFNKNVTELTDEKEIIDRSSLLINSLNADSFGIVSCSDDKEVENYVNKISSALSDKKVSFIGNVLKSTEILKKTLNVDSILLMEKIESTKLSDLNEAMKSFSSLGKKVDGYWVIG